MNLLHKLSLLLFLVGYLQFQAFGQGPTPLFDCGGIGNDRYQVEVTNPNTTDADNGAIDGTCNYILRLSTSNSPFSVVSFNYIGVDALPTPSSPSFVNLLPNDPNFNSALFIIVSPCGNANIEFDITDFGGTNSSICLIRYVLMPVELTYFKATTMKKGVLLNWETASEIDNLGFDIERSTNGKTWKKVAFIEGNLTTLSTQQYQFIDTSPHEGQSYYRLKQMDVDGEYQYSEIITSNYQSSLVDFGIFPNPSGESITLSLSEELEYEEVKITLFDNLGRIVKQEILSSNNLNISELQDGIHLLVVEIKQERYTARFMKN